MKHKFIFMLIAIITAGLHLNAYAGNYVIDHSKSHIEFSGEHAGNQFTGVFTDWDADINFDPDALADSMITARFDLSSAATGNKMFDGTLPQSDWFDIKNHPEPATFKSNTITANKMGGYTVSGALTIRGITHPITFYLTLSDVSQQPIIGTAQLQISRLEYDIGKKSDPGADWVSEMIEMNLYIFALAR